MWRSGIRAGYREVRGRRKRIPPIKAIPASESRHHPFIVEADPIAFARTVNHRHPGREVRTPRLHRRNGGVNGKWSGRRPLNCDEEGAAPGAGRDLQGMRVYRSDVVSWKRAEARPPRSLHRLDEPTGRSLSMVRVPAVPIPFRPVKSTPRRRDQRDQLPVTP